MAGRWGGQRSSPGAGLCLRCSEKRSSAGAQAMIGQLNQEAADLGLPRSDTHVGCAC